MPKNWNRRFKHKPGQDQDRRTSTNLAEVVRNLAIREHQKGLSTGEKQMFTRAKKILASELMYALEMDDEQVDEHLTGLLPHHLIGQRLRPGRGRGRRRVAPGGRVGHWGDGGRADRGRRAWRAPWVWPAQGARHRCGTTDAVLRAWRRCAACGGGADHAWPCRPTRLTPRRPGPWAVAGGEIRSQSVAAALQAADSAGDPVIVQIAAARWSLLSCLRGALRELESSGADAVVAAAPVTDTIKQASAEPSGSSAPLSAAGCGRCRPHRCSGRPDAGAPRGRRVGATACPGHRRCLADRAGGRSVMILPAPADNLKITDTA